MDHWGDPWADNNHADDKSLPKNEVTSSLPPTPAPVFNGFLDDAGWGNEDDGFGEWATASGNNETPETTDSRIDASSPIGPHDATSDDVGWDAEEKSEPPLSTSADAWSGAAQDDVAEDVDNVLSETSNSSTTIQPPESPAQTEADASDALQPDYSSSARLSTSPSETSHTGAAVESPRTSIEDDRAAGKSPVVVERGVEVDTIEELRKESDETPTVTTQLDGEIADDEFGNFSEDTSWNEETPSKVETGRSIESDAIEESKEPKIVGDETQETSLPTTSTAAGNSNIFILDLALVDELSPTPEVTKEQEEGPEDPIYSTTGRKAWYRLTRKQTLREFNNGTGDDNHTRVTWAKSNVRLEVNKTVARWAREDRISGTGPGARASFYWDTTAPVDVRASKGHSRTQSSMPTPRVAAPIRQSLPPLSTNTPAAFNWSSPSASLDPWKQDSPGLPSTSPLGAQRRIAVEPIQRHEDYAVSVDPLPLNPKQVLQERPPTAITETQGAANLFSPSISSAPTSLPDPWANPNSLDNHSTAKKELVIAPVDDEDDWGEMISSPTVSNHFQTDMTSQPTTRNNTLSTPSATPVSAEASPAQESPETMHIAQIVRLNGTISPTSALFRAKSFVPPGAEQGPIGPGILKPVSRAIASTLDMSKSEVQPSLSTDVVVERKAEEGSSQVDGSRAAYARNVVTPEPGAVHLEDDDFSGFESNTVPDPTRPSTPPPLFAVSAHLSTDSWADADFSFFESALPSTTLAPSQAKHDPSDPSSAFEAPSRSTSAEYPSKPFTRSTPQNLTPPPLQPLTGATNAAQRRKAEDDDIIRSILDGLPDLSYMLR